MDIVIVTSGDKQHGMGHVARMSVLARSLLSRGHKITFLTPKSTAGETILSQQFDNVISHRGDHPPARFFRKLLPDVFIVDIEHGPFRPMMIEAKKYSHKLVVIGGVGFYILQQDYIDELVDLQIHQTAVVTHEASLKSKSAYLSGAEYIILDEAYVNARAKYDLLQEENIYKKPIVVSLGGADPHGLTGGIANSLAGAFPANNIVAVYGPASQKSSRKLLARNVTIVESLPPHDFAKLMSEASFLVTALGMTVYEAMCVGVPVCCTAWSRDHEETVEGLLVKNVVIYLGMWDKIDKGAMFAFGHNVMSSPSYRRARTYAGWSLVDGQGTERVVRAIEGLIQ